MTASARPEAEDDDRLARVFFDRGDLVGCSFGLVRLPHESRGRKRLQGVANSAVMGRRDPRRVARGEKSDSIAFSSASQRNRKRATMGFATTPLARARVQGAQTGTHAPEPRARVALV